jgi:hypothetical protein
MYIFTLVDDIEKAIEKLKQQQGDFRLAMLYNDVLEASYGWNLIVSAPWADKLGIAESTRLIANTLNATLETENQSAISRITVLKPTDPFVRDMTKLYPVELGSRIPLAHVTAGEVTEGSGFIFYSQKTT